MGPVFHYLKIFYKFQTSKISILNIFETYFANYWNLIIFGQVEVNGFLELITEKIKNPMRDARLGF
jgi:hypothetical protein